MDFFRKANTCAVNFALILCGNIVRVFTLNPWKRRCTRCS